MQFTKILKMMEECICFLIVSKLSIHIEQHILLDFYGIKNKLLLLTQYHIFLMSFETITGLPVPS